MLDGMGLHSALQWYVDGFVERSKIAAKLEVPEHRHLLSLETDCWDVHAAIAAGRSDFVLLDVHSPQAYALGHVPTASNLPLNR